MRRLHRMDGRSIHHPEGFSLIEVIMATAILLGSVIMLSRLSAIGRSHVQNTRLHASAQQVCESLLNELLMGTRPLSPVERQPLLPLPKSTDERREPPAAAPETVSILQPPVPPDTLLRSGNTPRWLHSIRVAPNAITPGLVTVTVQVIATQPVDGRRIRFSLTRWVQQPVPQDPFTDLGSEFL